jgi:hypothetical protein
MLGVPSLQALSVRGARNSRAVRPGQQRVQGRPVADTELAAGAVVELDRRQQATVAGTGDGGLGGRLVDDRPVGPGLQVRGGGQVADLVVVVYGQVAAGRARNHLGGVHPVAQRVVGVVAECDVGTHITKQPDQPVTAGWLRHGFPPVRSWQTAASLGTDSLSCS